MDMTTAFRSEVFRPIVTLVIPGAIAIFPFVLLTNNHFPGLSEYRDNHEAVYFTVIALLTVGVGMLISDIGTYIEDFFDKRLSTKYPKAISQWYEYLRLDASKQTIGHGYLRSALLHLRFELTLALSFLPFFIGMVLLNQRTCWFSSGFMWGLGLGLLGTVALLIWAAYTTAILLIKVRANMFEPYA